MGSKSVILAVFAALLNLCNAQAQQFYIAAVTEFSPIWDRSLNDHDNTLRNAQEFVTLIQQASRSGATIIVFPEYALTTTTLPSNLQNVSTVLPDPTERIVPCNNNLQYAKFLVDLSCAAITHNIHVVVNLVEQSTTSTNETIYYNTNVVLDVRGAVAARYRKINLYNEPQFTAGEDVVAYTTDFGVTFGLVTCFDLLFKKPALDLIYEHNVTDVLYPNAWSTEMPFLHSLSFQDGFAKSHGVNLLAAGYSSPSTGSAGSGIFLGNGKVGAKIISMANVRQMIFASVPTLRTPTPEAACDPSFNIEPRGIGSLPGVEEFGSHLENLEHYTFADIDIGVNETSGEVCSEGSQFCCSFRIVLSEPLNATSTVYKMAAFFGVRGFRGSSSTIGQRNCAIVACSTNDSSTCGHRPAEFNVHFKEIDITGTLPSSSEPSYMPSTLTRNLEPVVGYSFCRDTTDDGILVRMNGRDVVDLWTFGIFGRTVELDGQEIGRGGAAAVAGEFYLVLSGFVAMMLARN